MNTSLGFNFKFWIYRLNIPSIKFLYNQKDGRFFADWAFLEIDEWNTKMPLNICKSLLAVFLSNIMITGMYNYKAVRQL